MTCSPRYASFFLYLVVTLVRHPVEIFKLTKTLCYIVIVCYSFHSSKFINKMLITEQLRRQKMEESVLME